MWHNLQITEVCSQNEMSDNKVRKLCWGFSDGCINNHNDDGRGRPSLVIDELMQRVDKKFVKTGISQ